MSAQWIRRGIALFLLILVAALVVSRAVDRGINHDEHQFLAPALLLTGQGLLPYRDYPLFHLPNLTFIYGAAAALTPYKLLAARLLCALAAIGSVVLLFRIARKAFVALSPGQNLILSVATTALFATSMLFVTASGLIWNHDIPTFLALLAFIFVLKAEKGPRPVLWMGLAGLSLGAAIGSRLTFAPLAAPFLISPFLFTNLERREQFKLACSLGLGLGIALLPTFYFLANWPDQFLFGNFGYPRLALTDPTNERVQKTITLWRKVRFFLKEVVLADIPSYLALLAIGIPGLRRNLRSAGPLRMGSGLLLLCVPFLLMGCFAPSRYQYQHFYCLAPFVVVGVIFGAAAMIQEERWKRAVLPVIVGLALIGAICTGSRAQTVAVLGQPREWTPLKVHRLAGEIAALSKSGKVLTLAPMIPMEAGLEIYPSFATGPFAWRSSHLVHTERRKKMHIVGHEEVINIFQTDRPASVLLGYEENRLEDPLREQARAHGYVRHGLGKKRELWVRP